MSSTLALIFIGVAVLFILGIKFLSSPKTARDRKSRRRGRHVRRVSSPRARGCNWSQGWTFNYTLIVIGMVIGLVIGAIGAYSVKMTAMPQMVAVFNGLGGGAAALVASLEFLRRAHSPEGITAFVAGSHAVRHAHRLALVFRQHHRVSESWRENLKSRTRFPARTF